MRILHIYKDFEPHKGGGGVARHIYSLARQQSLQGCSVVVAAPNPEDITANFAIAHLNIFSAFPLIKQSSLVHIHGARIVVSACCAVLAFVLRKPVVYTPHCYYDNGSVFTRLLKRIWDRVIERRLLTYAKRVILLNDSWSQYLHIRGMPAKAIEIIPNCVSYADLKHHLEQPRHEQFVDGYPAIFYLGRLDTVKRVDDLILALTKPNLTDATLHLVGKGPELQRLQALANQYGLTARVHFHGFLADNETFALAKRCHCFVLPSENEGLPTVILEMLLAKVPVICSRIPGNLAITDAVGISSTYDVGDIDGLATLLIKYRELKVEDATVLRVRQLFTWEYRAEQIIDIYRQYAGT